jgi:hypothetical protein
MEKSVRSRVTMKLNMTASYCNDLRLERYRMNYATSRALDPGEDPTQPDDEGV